MGKAVEVALGTEVRNIVWVDGTRGKDVDSLGSLRKVGGSSDKKGVARPWLGAHTIS